MKNIFGVHVLALVSLLVVTSRVALTTNETKPSFPDLFGILVGRDRFRFQYELNVIITAGNHSKHQSFLMDEAFSLSSLTGRLLLDSNGLPETHMNAYNIFYWIKNKDIQETYWLKPFTCCSSYAKASDRPFKSCIIDKLLPERLDHLTVYKNPEEFTLYGLAALLANTFDNYPLNLKRVQRSSPTITDDDQLEERKMQTVEWILEYNSEIQLEFSLVQDTGATSQINPLSNLRITFNRLVKGDEICVAQIQVHKMDLDFADHVLALPQGYSCHRNMGDRLRDIKSGPLITSRGIRKKFTFEFNVITRDEALEKGAGSSYEHFQIPEPLDSIRRPVVESKVVTFIDEVSSKYLIFISQQSGEQASSAGSTSGSESTLTLYDFSRMRKTLLQQRSSRCNQQVSFMSSLFTGKSEINLGKPTKSCPAEGVQVELSSDLSLSLNSDGYSLLEFTLQDRDNPNQLIDQLKLNDDGTKLELVYERLINERLCLYQKSSNSLVGWMPVKLVSKYHYDSTAADSHRKWMPKSSSILFFDEPSSKLMMQIDMKLLHFEEYDPWAQARHLLDMTSCYLGPKQSAKLTIEYPLTRDNVHLKQFNQPHQLIRSALANYLRMTYMIGWQRIPSIEVDVSHDQVEVEVQLLDQPHFLHDSELLSRSNASRDKFMDWLSQAPRSVLLASVEDCAEYCEQYHCQVFTYCKFTTSCYVFNSLQSLNLNGENQFGSFRSAMMDCQSYKVSASRSEAANFWRKNSWSLEETLESIVNAVNRPNTQPGGAYANIATTGLKTDLAQPEEDLASQYRLSVTRPNIEMLAKMKIYNYGMVTKLEPSFAHFRYDNLRGEMLARAPVPSYLHGSARMNLLNQGSSKPAAFKLALPGYEFYQLNKGLGIVHDFLSHVDLEDSEGYLLLTEHDLEACARICLGDPGCAYFSYCSPSDEGKDVTNNCIVSSLDNRGFSMMLDSLVNGIPIEDLQQSFGDAEEESIHNLGLRKNPSCSIAMRTFSDQFQQLEFKTLYNLEEVSMDDVVGMSVVSNGEQCASSCARQRYKALEANELSGDASSDLPSACLSYDFCKPFEKDDKSPSACVYYNKHLVSASGHKDHVKGDHKDPKPSLVPSDEKSLSGVLRNDLKLAIHSFCWHYVRNFLTDFHKLPHKRLTAEITSHRIANYILRIKDENAVEEHSSDNNEELDELIEDVSLERCARLCEEAPDCGAFQYCAASYKLAPSGLYLSCTLGSNSTLKLSPASERHRRQLGSEPSRLKASKICSVYIYKSLSLLLSHKKKNLRNVEVELMKEAQELSSTDRLELIRLHLIVLLIFLVFGFVVKDIGLERFGFTRFTGHLTRGAETGTGTGTDSEAAHGTRSIGIESSVYEPASEIRLETIAK